MTEKSLDERTFAEKFANLMKAPIPENFQEAMEVANPEGEHKKEVWAKNVKKIKKKIDEDENVTQKAKADNILTAARRRKAARDNKIKSAYPTQKTKISRNYSGSKVSVKVIKTELESEQEEWSDEVLEKVAKGFDKTLEKYILIKGIPISESGEETIWLKVKAGDREYYFDQVTEESISISFEEDPANFPLQLEISIWDEKFPEDKFKRIGIFPKDPSIKRVVTDLSSRGREVKGVTEGSQESVKKFIKRIAKKRSEQPVDKDWFGGSVISSGGFVSRSCSGIMVTSAIGMPTIVQGTTQSAWTVEKSLTDDSDLTENMEVQLEEKIKTAVNDLKDEIRNDMLEELRREIYQDLQNGKVDLPKDDMVPNFGEVANNAQIYSQYDLQNILAEMVKNQKDKNSNIIPPISDEPFNHRDMDLGALVVHTGVPEWEAENRLEEFFEKVIKGEENDHGDLG